MENIIFYLFAYLLGGIPFGYLLAKYVAKIDIRKYGSGNIGATNVLRVVKEKDPALAKKLSIATLVFDALKGMIVILIAKFYGMSYSTLWTIAVLSVVGHTFSPFLGFKGGKGVATTLGVLIVLVPIETIIGIVVWFIMAKTLKISSISSLTGILVGILSSFIIHPDMPHIHSHAPLIIIAFIVFYKHIPNIINLIQGKEKRVI